MLFDLLLSIEPSTALYIHIVVYFEGLSLDLDDKLSH